MHRRQAFESPEPLGATDHAQLQPAAAQKPRSSDSLWLAPRESRACGFGEMAQPTPQGQPAGAAPPPPTEADGLIDRLAENSWVDLFAGQQWRRARLVWTGTRRTLFMFVSEGGQPHSMSRRTLQRLVAERALRPVEAHAVVQRAIDTLAAQPRQAQAQAQAA
jgi:hypothetical protein